MGVQKLRGVATQCFVGGTEVLVGSADGGRAEADIEGIQVNDLVWTKDEADPDGPLVLRPVTRVYATTAYDLQAVSARGADGNVEVFRVTDEHPFYVPGRGWTGAAALRPGFELVSSDGARPGWRAGT